MTITSAENERISAAAQMEREVVNRVKEVHAEASAELIVDLREMVNNPAFSDVVFLCNDGKPVRALRMFLASRSEVLRSMLANGMAESNRDEITLAAVSSPVMLSVLEFLYTGTLCSYHVQSWKKLWEVLIASQFFLLPNLRNLVGDFLLDKICNAAHDLAETAILLTEAMGFKDLCGEADYIFEDLVTVLSSDWSDSSFVKNLSVDAFHYLLANSRSAISNSDLFHADIFSFREYFRFRGVIQWWVHQSSLQPSAEELLMTFLVADVENFLRKYDLDSAPKLNECEVYWADLQSVEIPKVAAMKLLSNIEYRLIHPILLAVLVEPLNYLLERSCMFSGIMLLGVQ